jgi:PAS domain S-box-containing protein
LLQDLPVSSEKALSTVESREEHPAFLSLAETLSSFIALIQGDRLIYVNPAGCALLGRPGEFFVGRRLWDVIHPDDRQAAIVRGEAHPDCDRRAGLPGAGSAGLLVERFVHADGRTVWMECSLDVIRFEGQPTTLVTGHDVTERMRAEEELRRSEANLAEAQRIAQVGSWEWDMSTDRVRWSEELFRIFGLDPARVEASYELFLSRLHPDDRAMISAAGERAATDGNPFECELRMIRPDGEVRTLWTSGRVDVDGSGRAIRMYGAVQDVTDRHRARDALEQSEERFRLAFHHAAIGKAIITPDGRILQANPAACRMLGYAEAEILRLRTSDITHPADVAETDGLVLRLLEGPQVSAAIEKRFLRKDGCIVWALLTATLVRDPAGNPLYFLAEVEDVTERKRAEEALRESEERFRNLCTQAPVMLMSFDPDGRVRDVSDYWLLTMGYEREEIVGQDAWRLITPESQARLRAAIEANQRNQETVIKNLPLRGIRKDGTTVDLLSTSVAQLGDDGKPKGAICVEIDLTDFQRAEAALRESEERYRALVEHAPEAIMVLDVETDRFVDANAHAEKLFGFPRDKLVTMGPLDFCRECQADGRRSSDVVEDEHRKVLEGEPSTFEFTHVDAAGREIACQTTLSRLPASGRKLIRVSTIDVTELKQLQEKIRHADKLAAAGVLAAGVAHEIGNPLMALSMAAQSLERRACDEYSQAKLVLIREHIDRISRIVRQMSDLARPHNGQRGSCDLNAIVRRAVDMVRYDRRSKGSVIEYELAEHVPAVEAIEDELTQVCINLALNAFDAMAANPPDRPRRLTVGSAASGPVVRVSFRDTGPGVAPEARSKLFQPFFTTKEAGQGTGLGLSVSYRILQEHGGTLRLEEDGHPGATFVFELPVVKS